MNKKGKITKQTVLAVVILLVLIVVLFQVWAALVPEAQTAGDTLNETARCDATAGCIYNSTNSSTIPCRLLNLSEECSSGQPSIPLSGLFASAGVVFVIIMASLFLVTLIGVFAMLKGKGK